MDYKEKIIGILTNNELTSEQKRQLEKIFPELKENEDEKIRKAILELVRQSSEVLEKQNQNNMIAWLEKQGEEKEIDYNEELKKCKDNPLYFFDKYVKVKLKEQKPIWSKEDMETIDRIHNFIMKNRKGDTSEIYQQEKDANWLKSIKDRVQPQPKQAWGNADKRHCQILQNIIYDSGVSAYLANKLSDWLNSLKDRIQPQLKQKWSEEDENMCESVIDIFHNNTMSGSKGSEVYSEEMNWLESLKQRLKGK